jgi:hypothetical protein
MNKANLVGVHEAGIAHHVAAVSQVNRQHGSAAILDGAGSVVMKFLVVVSIDVATRKHLFYMRQELDVDCHHVLEVPVNRTILDHPNFAITLDDLGLNFADFLVNQNANVLLSADNRFPGLDHAVRTKRIRGSRPTQGWLALLPGFQQGFVRPLRCKGWIWFVFIN